MEELLTFKLQKSLSFFLLTDVLWVQISIFDLIFSSGGLCLMILVMYNFRGDFQFLDPRTLPAISNTNIKQWLAELKLHLK